ALNPCLCLCFGSYLYFYPIPCLCVSPSPCLCSSFCYGLFPKVCRVLYPFVFPQSLYLGGYLLVEALTDLNPCLYFLPHISLSVSLQMSGLYSQDFCLLGSQLWATVLPTQVLAQTYWKEMQMVHLPPTSLFCELVDGLGGPGVVLGVVSYLVVTDPGNEI
ncbi:hypothetical protein N302_00351, partial [Corvus brachyrhynchos]